MRLVVTAVVLLALVGLSLPRERAAAHTGYWRVTGAGNGLRLREGPGGQFRIITVMPDGSLTKAFGHSGNWLKVRYLATGQIGWAFLSYFTPASGGGDPPASGLRLCYATTFGGTACAAPWIAEIIYAAARAYGIGPFWLMSIAACESGFDPNAWAYSPPDNVYGIFQFRPSTMAWVYPGGSVWSVSDSAYAAAKLLTIAPAQFDCAWRLGFL